MGVALQIFRVIASCTSLFMLLSPSPMVYNIFKTKSTGVVSIVPLASVLVNANMWMMYGYLDENYVPLFATFVVGDLLACTYLIVYYCYTTDRARAHRVLAVAALAMAVTITYCVVGGFGYTGQTRHEAATGAGIIADITGTLMYASPLVMILKVFKYKSAAFMPIHMVCVGSTNNVVWIVYCFLAKKWIILVPSVIALSLGVFQMILYFFVFHPSTHPLPLESALKDSQDDASQTDVDAAHLTVVVHSPVYNGDKLHSEFVHLQSPSTMGVRV